MTQKYVFYLHRYGFKIYQVNGTTAKLLSEKNSLDLTDLEDGLNSYRGITARLLMADQISYLYQTDVIDTPPVPLRQSVLSKIKTAIPDDIDSMDWDFKIINTSKEKKRILFFAPIRDFQTFIKSIASEFQITFEAIEPESVSASRHPDPVVGLSIKDDISGRDETVLNIFAGTRSSMSRFKITYVVAILAIISVVFVAGSLYKKFTPVRQDSSKPVPDLQAAVSPTSIPTVTLVPTVPAIDISKVAVKILNASGINGAAGALKLKIEVEGFQNIEVGNAKTETLPSSGIVFKSKILKEQFFPIIKKYLSIEEKNISVDNTAGNDIIITIGT